MRITLAFIILSFFSLNTYCLSPDLVLSQVYKGNGPVVSYVEILNRGSQPVNINGYTLQFKGWLTDFEIIATLPNVFINPGQYYLVAQSNIFTVAPDFTNTWGAFEDVGTIALVRNSVVLTSCQTVDCDPPDPNIADKFAYNGGSCQEGAAISDINAAYNEAFYRIDNGCTDTDDNYLDWVIGPRAPRSSFSALHICPTPLFPTFLADPPAVNGLVITVPGNPSNTGTYTLTGSHLLRYPDIIILGASVNVEISPDGINFGPNVVLFFDSDTLLPTTVYVRLIANATGTTGNIQHCGGLATNFIVPVNSGTVPLKLINFTVKKQNAFAQLNWTTLQELNIKSFIIERSTDQNQWDAIGNVNAAGNSAERRNYNTIDFNPAKGVNYYRLKMVDTDGRFIYSETRLVYFGNDAAIAIVPNPAKEKATLFLPGNTSFTSISIYDMNGRLMKKIHSNEESVQVDLRNIPKGIYLVKLTGININAVRKLLVD